MRTVIQSSLRHTRSVLLILLLILISGTASYISIPKESSPDVAIPMVNVSIHHEGISAADSERLLIRPMETELRSVEGLDEINSTASESNANIMVKFEAGFDIDKALRDVRDKVDTAKSDLPGESDDPVVSEINIALFPVLVITLSGDVSDRTLITIANDLKDKIESISGVHEANIAGDKDELIEIVIDPKKMESYQLSQNEIFQFVARNNRLVAAGALDTGEGRFSIKVPGVFEEISDILDVPIKVDGKTVIKFSDIATGQRVYKDPLEFARVNGKPAIALEISKSIGANVIDTLSQVKQLVSAEQARWPQGIDVGFSQDQSIMIDDMLRDLQNNVIFAVILVMIVIIAALGLRAAGLVGMAIPGSFVTGILILSALDFTINMVVLFSLIMSVGMLVDGAIVVVEIADRKMAEGLCKKQAYMIASKRMAWPIIASTATTLAAFAPLIVWPGIMGEFMKYLPITLIATLAASLFMALIFVPALGSIFGKRAPDSARNMENLAVAESGDLSHMTGFTKYYIKLLTKAVQRPALTLLAIFSVLVVTIMLYGALGKGVELFPEVEPENGMVLIHARGDLSVYERDKLVAEVEEQILKVEGFSTIYTRSGLKFGGPGITEDVIGIVQLEFADWKIRRPAEVIFQEIRDRTAHLKGITIEAQKQKEGPNQGKAIQLELSSMNYDLLPPTIERLSSMLHNEIEGLINISDSRPIPGIEWQLQVDRAEASKYGADITTLGNAVQMVTNGINVGTFRPDNSDDEIDIRIRFPEVNRSIDQLKKIRIPTHKGVIPASNFVRLIPKNKIGKIERVDGRRVLSIEADTTKVDAEGNPVTTDQKIKDIQSLIEKGNVLPQGVNIRFRGDNEEQVKAMTFLSKAFLVAVFMIAIILVTQFNSFFQSFLILSAVIFSTAGVLLAHLISGHPFGIVMSGIGVISLAGIVVNNNIVLIDTYNQLIESGMEAAEAIVRTGAQRLRPVLLTTVTTILGLMPMVLGLNIDLIGRNITIDAPSAQWWKQLASSVAGGLTFATVLTLVLTPSLLMLGYKLGHRRAGTEHIHTENDPPASFVE